MSVNSNTSVMRYTPADELTPNDRYQSSDWEFIYSDGRLLFDADMDGVIIDLSKSEQTEYTSYSGKKVTVWWTES